MAPSTELVTCSPARWVVSSQESQEPHGVVPITEPPRSSSSGSTPMVLTRTALKPRGMATMPSSDRAGRRTPSATAVAPWRAEAAPRRPGAAEATGAAVTAAARAAPVPATKERRVRSMAVVLSWVVL